MVIDKNNADMVCNINNKIGDNEVAIHHTEKKPLTMEKVCAALCFLTGAVFLVMAVFGAWRYFFLMGLCLLVGIMIYEDDPDASSKRKRREDR